MKDSTNNLRGEAPSYATEATDEWEASSVWRGQFSKGVPKSGFSY